MLKFENYCKKKQQMQKRLIWLGKGRGKNFFCLPGAVQILAFKKFWIPGPPSDLGKQGWSVNLLKERRFPLLQYKGNYGRKRIEGPEEEVSRWRTDFRSCFLLVRSRLINMVAGGYL